MSKPGLPFPLHWVALDGVGAGLLAGGVYGLAVKPEGALEVLAVPELAWALIILGGAAMALAMSMILGALRQPKDRRSTR